MASDKQNIEGIKKSKSEVDTASGELRNRLIKHRYENLELLFQKLKWAELLPFFQFIGILCSELREITECLTHKKRNEKN